MNIKLIIFSSIVTAIVGAMIGLAAAKMRPTPYKSELYQNLEQKYAEVGAIAGLAIGAGQEAIRQLKKQRDQEEEEANRNVKYKQ